MSRNNEAAFICCACGTQFPPSVDPPVSCRICEDVRQFVPKEGQTWTTLARLSSSHKNVKKELEPHLYGIGTAPGFGIGQRALLLVTPSGNFLWDCISLIDETTIQFINGLGGLAGIAISHPHYYTTMVEWSRAFGGVPIYLHGLDREWVVQPDPAIVFWDEEHKEIAPGLTLLRLGGHFPGGTVLHSATGAGTIFSGDIIQVTPDGFVSFMFSYPNLIPLPAKAVEEIGRRLEPWAYDRIYGAWWDRVILTDATQIVRRSVRRYVEAIS